MEANFNINIRDNFFDKNTFTELYDKIPYLQYQPDQNMIDGIPHIWFSATVDPQLAVSIKERCEKTFNKKLTLRFCSYTMLATVEPTVHCDHTDKTSHQVIIYIRGNTDLHKGTGFYVLNNDTKKLDLNTHIKLI